MIESTMDTTQPVTQKPFPKLMRLISDTNELVVLMKEEKIGTIVHAERWDIGHYRTDWDMSKFEDYNGKIIIKNE